MGEQLFEAAPDALVVVDEHGRISLVNARAESLFGRARADLIGQELEPLVHALPVEIRAAAVELDGARSTLHAIRTTDEATRLKRELLPTMAHELRTPLNAIIGFSELIHKGRIGPAESHEYLGDVLASAHKLKILLDDLIDLARATPAVPSTVEVVDLEQLVHQVRDIVRGQAAARHQTLEVVIDPRARTATVDAVRLKRIIYELVTSAIHTAPEGAAIPIRVMPAESPELFRIEIDAMFSATLPRSPAPS